MKKILLLTIVVTAFATLSFAQQSTTPQTDQSGNAKVEKTRVKILYQEKAKYTDMARQNGVHGTVVLSCLFGSNGKVSEINDVKGLPHGLTEAALEAARKIKFIPATVNGQPVSERMKIEFTFDLLPGTDVESIVRMLNFDFPFLTKDTSTTLAKVFAKKSPETSMIIQWVIQCEAKGIEKLSPDGQSELLQLYKDAITTLPAIDRTVYEALLIKSQNNRLDSIDLERAFDYKNKGLANLSPEKKKSFIELHNKAVRLGFTEFVK